MMTYTEFKLAIQKCSTTLQIATEAPKYIGIEIYFPSTTLKEVGLYTIHVGDLVFLTAYDSYQWQNSEQISYDKDRFFSSLINLKKLDKVKIVVIIENIKTFGAGDTPYFHFVLVSIEKEYPPAMPIKSDSACFVATACYGDCNTPEVLILRKFRDEKILKFFWGRLFVKFYYSVSPFFATLISKSDRLKKIVRQYFLAPIIQNLQRQ